MPTAVCFLRWSDVDPEGRAFDPALAREIATERILGALEGDPARRLSLHAVEPLFVVARSALDHGGAWSFAWLVEYLLGPSAI